MSYEKDYPGQCFDFLIIEGGMPGSSFAEMLKEHYGVDIKDSEELRSRLLDLLIKAHEDGIIAPLK